MQDLTPKIACEGVWKLFGEGSKAVTALQDVNLQIRPNEFVTFVGASGCGKSTLLRTIAGLESHSRGAVKVDGVPITGPGQDRAMVFQHYSLYPWLNVVDNIRFCRQLSTHTPRAQPERCGGRLGACRCAAAPDGTDGPRPSPTPTSSVAACSSAWRLPAR